MPRSLRSRRLRGLALAGALAVTTVTLTATPASAAGLDAGTAEAATDFSSVHDDDPAETCALSGPGDTSVTSPITSNGVPVSLSTSSTATATASDDPADTTQMSASVNGTARATEVAGGIKTFDMSSTASATVTPAQGAASNCNSTASGSWTVTGMVNVPSTSVMVLNANTRGGDFLYALIQGTGIGGADDMIDLSITNQRNGKERRVVVVPAGTYTLVASMGAEQDSPEAAGESTSRSSVISLHAEFFAPGTATGPRTGFGKKYLKLDNALNCANHSVEADFTKKAGKKATAANGLDPKIRKAKFFVNGDKVATKSEPHKNTEVTLSGLPDTDEVAVRVVLKLWDKSKVEVNRSYLPCS